MSPWATPSTGPAADLAAALAARLPRIETERLVLRAPRIEDGAAYAAIYLSGRWEHGGEVSEEEAWLDFNFLVASWLLRGFGLFAVEEREGGALLGFAMLDHEFGDAEPEIGWALVEAAEGRGIATEAAAALLAHARGLGIAPVAHVGAGSPRSSAVAGRLGGRRDRAAEAALGDVEVWRFDAGREGRA